MTADRFALEHKVAVVTGAASGLGRAISSAMVGAGARVAALDVDVQANEGTAAQTGATPYTADVTDERALDAVIDEIGDQIGPIDVLVNSAGVAGRGAAESFDSGLLETILAANLKGTLFACQAVGRRLLAADRGGSIINIASIGGLVAYPGSVGYQASKGAVVQMTRTLAVEWAPAGIRVNAVAPGHIATDMVKQMWTKEPELKEFFLSRTPMGRRGDPIDVALPVVFLASDAAAMITGQVLAIDGGYTAQ